MHSKAHVEITTRSNIIDDGDVLMQLDSPIPLNVVFAIWETSTVEQEIFAYINRGIVDDYVIVMVA